MSEFVDRRNYEELARRIRAAEKQIDTWATPPWKRLWFLIQGYVPWRLGRWYRAPWNADAKEYDR